MHRILQQTQIVRGRWHRQVLWQSASAGLLVGGLTGIVLSALKIASGATFSWLWIAGVVTASSIAGLLLGCRKIPTLLTAARRIDRECGLKDRTQTALQFLATGKSGSALQHLQIEDAESHLRNIDPIRLTPIKAPASWKWAVISSAVAMLLAMISGQPERVQAATVPNEVVAVQAERTAASLEELERFREERPDPDLEKLLRALSEQVRELSDPGTDVKEALATLSEMEDALLQMQEHLTGTSTEQQLREIGDALSLAEPLAAAGEAMAQGNLEKAAAELAKAELPQLDRRTGKAITEKLSEVTKKNEKAGQKDGLAEAVEKVAQGLSQKNANEFRDGMQSLSSECKQQAQKQNLSELLKKQAQTLGESRSEIESEIRNQAQAQAQSNKRGGQQAGRGKTGSQNDRQTEQLKSGQEMKLTGQDSGTGDTEFETTSNPEQEQEAVRHYRSQAEKYEALSESVLQTESLPPGHRQTIRKYFELIRPQAAELDAIDKATSTDTRNGSTTTVPPP